MTKILLRRNTSTYFSTNNPVLASGEPAFAIDTNVLKIGDGVKGWNALAAVAGGGGGGAEINDLTSVVTWANVPDANITESSVVQHSGALLLTESQIVDLQNYLLNVVEDTTPQLGGNLDINNSDIVGTGNVDITGNITATSGNLDILSFNINSDIPVLKGQLSWDDTEGVIDMGLTDTLTSHIGEQRFYRVRNKTGSPLYKGQVVYATGVHSNGLITPAKYIANNTIQEVRFIGVVMETVNNNNNGYVADFGHIHNIDMQGSVASNYAVGDETWLNGDILYAHATVAGKLTKNKPKHAITVAIILDNSSNGRMFVRPTTFGDLNDNHTVSITNPSHNDFLVYNSGTDYWENNNLFNTDLVAGTGISLTYSSGSNELTISSNLYSDPTNIAGASGVSNIVVISSGDYAALGTYDASTIYFIR